MSTIEQACSLYHPIHGERAFEPGQPHPGEGWCDNPVDADLEPILDGDHPVRFRSRRSGEGNDAASPAPAPEYEREPDTTKPAPRSDVILPAEWRGLHHMKRIALAQQVAGGKVASLPEAMSILEAHEAAR